MLYKDDIIVKYLTREISPAEEQELDLWLAESEDNKGQLETWKRVWNDSSIESDGFEPDVDAAWQKVSQSIDQLSAVEETLLEPRIRPSTLSSFILRIAAVLVIGSTIVWTAYEMGQETMPDIAWATKITQDNQTSEILLADGSRIFLNKNSKFEYPESFDQDIREVRLVGEAYFEVATNPDKPFVVIAAGTRTQVVGTAFNIKAREDQEDVTISVTSGEVAFAEEKNLSNAVSLTKGFQGVFSREGRSLQRTEFSDPNLLAWQTGILIFDQTPLSQAVTVLSDFFGRPITLQGDNFGRCRLTSTFDNQSLEDVLEVIELVLEAQVENQPGEIRISGAGCQN